MAMKCTTCGREINPQDTLCPSCNSSLTSPKAGCASVAVNGCFNLGCTFVVLVCTIGFGLAGVRSPKRLLERIDQVAQRPPVLRVQQTAQ